MSKVYELFVDEDTFVNYKVHNSVQEFHNSVKEWNALFVDEYGLTKLDCVDISEEALTDMFWGEDDTLEERKKDYVEKGQLLNGLMESGKYVLYLYSVEYDVSMFMMEEKDFQEFIKLCKEGLEE